MTVVQILLAMVLLSASPAHGVVDVVFHGDALGSATVVAQEETDQPDASDGGSNTGTWVRTIGVLGLLGVWWWRGFATVRKRQKARKQARMALEAEAEASPGDEVLDAGDESGDLLDPEGPGPPE